MTDFYYAILKFAVRALSNLKPKFHQYMVILVPAIVVLTFSAKKKNKSREEELKSPANCATCRNTNPSLLVSFNDEFNSIPCQTSCTE